MNNYVVSFSTLQWRRQESPPGKRVTSPVRVLARPSFRATSSSIAKTTVGFLMDFTVNTRATVVFVCIMIGTTRVSCTIVRHGVGSVVKRKPGPERALG